MLFRSPGLATGRLCGLGWVIWPQPQFPRLLGCCEYIKHPAHSRYLTRDPPATAPPTPQGGESGIPASNRPHPAVCSGGRPAAHKPLSFDLSSFRRAGRDGGSSQPSPSASSPPYTSASINLCTPAGKGSFSPRLFPWGAPTRWGFEGVPRGRGPAPGSCPKGPRALGYRGRQETQGCS